MANVKKGNTVRPPQWWKHLRDWKRVFWKAERKAAKREVKDFDFDNAIHTEPGENLIVSVYTVRDKKEIKR